MGARLPSQVPPLFQDAAFYADFTRCGAQDIAEACLIGGRNPFTFTRSSQATYFGPDGQIHTAANNAPRFDYDPVLLTCKGLLIEEQRTNSFLNSGSPASQTVTVTNAASWTISFYGTGSIAYTGAATGTLSGTGAFPTRVSVTVTTSSTSLVLVLSGTVTDPQVELGSFATSYIPTAGSSATRGSEAISVSGVNYSLSLNNGFCTLLADRAPISATPSGTFPATLQCTDGTSNNRFTVFKDVGVVSAVSTAGGTGQSSPSSVTDSLNVFALFVGSFSPQINLLASNGVGSSVSGLGGVPSGINQIAQFCFNDHLKRVAIWQYTMSLAMAKSLSLFPS